MKMKKGDKVVVFALIIIAAVVIYLSYTQRQFTGPYASANLGEAPNQSTYANAFYGMGGPMRNSVPPVADTLFDTKY